MDLTRILPLWLSYLRRGDDDPPPGTEAAEARSVAVLLLLLLVQLTGDDLNAAAEAAPLLGALGSRRALPLLIGALQAKHISLVVAAARALGLMRDRRAVEPLMHLVRSQPGEPAAAAMRSLRILGDPRALPVYLEALGDLGRGAEEARLAVIEQGRLAIPALQEFLAPANVRRWPWQARVAVGILEELDLEGSLEFLLSLVTPRMPRSRSDPRRHVRRAAARALGRSLDARAVKLVRREARHYERLLQPPTRSEKAAAYALAEIGCPESLGPLLDSLDHVQKHNRYYVILSIGGLRGPDRVQSLLEAARDLDRHPRLALPLALALREIGTPEAIGVLQALRTDPDDGVRDRAELSLKALVAGEGEGPCSLG